MITFWLIAAAFSLAALLILAAPLWQGSQRESVDRGEINREIYEQKLAALQDELEEGLIDQKAYEQAELELQKTLLGDVEEEQSEVTVLKTNNTGLIAALFLVLPVLSVLLYMQFSTGYQMAGKPQQGEERPESLEEAIASLQQRLAQNPDNLDGWKMLGRSYFITERFDDAKQAYLRANELAKSQDPEILVSIAEASVYGSGQEFTVEDRRYLKTALELDQKHERALWYSGMAAYQFKEFKPAIAYWERLVPLIPADKENVKASLNQFLQAAREQTGVVSPPAIAESAQIEVDSQEQPAAQRQITVSAQLGAALQDKVSSQDTLFIYARAAQGPRMPLALARMQVKDLPVTVTLTEAMSMVPNMTLASFDQVVVLARVSKSGQAITQSGDLIGESAVLDATQLQEVLIVIDQIAP